MARHEQSYTGERRTAQLTIQLTRGERAEIETAAGRAGVASLSAYARLLLLRRLAEFELFVSPQRNPDVRGLIRELSAIGNNLNQLARIANATKAIEAVVELAATTELLKAAIARVLGL
jgi:Bacterial mobilisation protein (MobC)